MMNSPQAWDERAALATSWEAALWSEEGQRRRFEAIEHYLDLGIGDSVLDYGCGTGGLCEFLPPTVNYFGWDWSPKMRERARKEHPSATILNQAPRVKVYDHIVCCGVFNLAENWTHEQTWNVVRQLWKQTGKSLVLSLYRGTDPYSLRYSLDEIADCIWRLSIRKYVVDCTYADNDILVCLLR